MESGRPPGVVRRLPYPEHPGDSCHDGQSSMDASIGPIDAPAYTTPGGVRRRAPMIGGHRAVGDPAGRHFLQIPGPTNVPDRILRAIETPHHRPPRARVPAARQASARGPARDLPDPRQHADLPIVGHRRMEAALVNTLSAEDTVPMSETGHFSTLWPEMARRRRGSRVPRRRGGTHHRLRRQPGMTRRCRQTGRRGPHLLHPGKPGERA